MSTYEVVDDSTDDEEKTVVITQQVESTQRITVRELKRRIMECTTEIAFQKSLRSDYIQQLLAIKNNTTLVVTDPTVPND